MPGEILERCFDLSVEKRPEVAAGEADAHQRKQDARQTTAGDIRGRIVHQCQRIGDAALNVAHRLVAFADRAAHRCRVEDRLDAVFRLQLAGAGGDHRGLGHAAFAAHDFVELVLDEVFRDMAGARLAGTLEANHAGYGEVEEARHLHVGVLGIHPDLDAPHVAQIAGDQRQPAAAVADRVAVDVAAPDHPGRVADPEAEGLVHVAVRRILAEAGRDRPANAAARLRVDRPPAAVVLDRVQVGDVERQGGVAIADDDRHRAVQGVADAQFVEDVRVRQADIGDRHIGAPDHLKHALVDVACLVHLVATNALEAFALDRRLDEILIDRVEVDLLVGGVELGAERHDDEAAFAVGLGEILVLQGVDQRQHVDRVGAGALDR